MDTYIPRILTLIILLFLSAFFSANETALTSANKIRLRNQSELGDKKALLASKLLENYDSALTTLLISNNIVNILSASIATVLFTEIVGESGVVIATSLMTILVIIFGEVLPKSLAKMKPEELIKKSIKILNFLIFVMTPFTIILNFIKSIFTKEENKDIPSVTEEELICIIDEIEEEGVLKEDQAELVQNAIEFNDISASEIITHRVDITAVNIKEELSNLKDLFFCFNYSRIPVYEESIDHICGFVNQKDLFSKLLKEENFEWQELIKPCIYVPPKKKIIDIMKRLQKEKVHMAIVTDEYGGTLGILTLEDILEQLVGEIWDEHDEIMHSIKKNSDNSYTVMGSIMLQELYEEIIENIRFSQENETLSSYLLNKMNKIPESNETFTDEHFKYTILEMNDNRIIKVKIEQI